MLIIEHGLEPRSSHSKNCPAWFVLMLCLFIEHQSYIWPWIHCVIAQPNSNIQVLGHLGHLASHFMTVRGWPFCMQERHPGLPWWRSG